VPLLHKKGSQSNLGGIGRGAGQTPVERIGHLFQVQLDVVEVCVDLIDPYHSDMRPEEVFPPPVDKGDIGH
jgi:hypothetical protein